MSKKKNQKGGRIEAVPEHLRLDIVVTSYLCLTYHF